MSNLPQKEDESDLQFPIDPEFYSDPPKMTLEEYLRYTEPKVPYGQRDRRRGPENSRPPEEPFEL